MRRYIAFLVAPLVVPVMVLWQMSAFDSSAPWRWLSALSLITAYLGVWLLGRPIVRLLTANEWTSIWIAPPAGFAVGVIAWYVFFLGLLLPFILGGPFFDPSALTDPKMLDAAVRLGGLSGAAVGVLYWLIARPDLNMRAVASAAAKEGAAPKN